MATTNQGPNAPIGSCLRHSVADPYSEVEFDEVWACRESPYTV